jgi:hypothetical protein
LTGVVQKALASFVLAIALVACRASSPAGGAEATCAKACEARIEKCSASQCGRECNFIMDRLVEHEGDRVLACVAKSTGACVDATFSACAVLVGVHADGGPPPPKPPTDDDE